MLNTDDADIRYGRIVIKFEADNLTNEQLQLIGGLVGMGFEENCPGIAAESKVEVYEPGHRYPRSLGKRHRLNEATFLLDDEVI